MNNFLIDETTLGSRLDKYLTKELDYSRSKIQAAIKSGEILVNQKLVNSNYILKLDDYITVNFKAEEPFQLVASDLPIEIVYQDDNFLIVDKPAGLVVHSGAALEKDSVVARLINLKIPLAQGNEENRPGIVHRLDKDTSGLLIVAKTKETLELLKKQLAKRDVIREYTCLVFGEVIHDYGTIDAPIGRDPRQRQKMAVTHLASKEALTTFEVIKRFKDYTLLKCQLTTGRTHQIRVHLNYINHPIVGDLTYAKRSRFNIKRQLLHASYLSFEVNGKTYQFNSALPADFEEVLKEVKAL